MKRPLVAATRGSAGYPRVGAAWRILAGAAPIALASSLALADASPPPAPGEPCPGGKRDPPPPTKKRPDPPPPPLGGKPMPPKSVTVGDATRMMMHPHQFDEPCYHDREEADDA